MQEPINIPVKHDGDLFNANEVNTIVDSININIQDITALNDGVNVGLDYIIPNSEGGLDV